MDIKWLNSNLEQLIEELNKENRKSKSYSFLRILNISVFLWSFYKWSTAPTMKEMFGIISFVLIGIFLFCIGEHSKVRSRICETKKRIFIVKKFISRFNGGWIKYDDDGREYLDDEHPYVNDLDIFGAKSVYQYINATKTPSGKRKIIDLLKGNDISKEKILNRQRGVNDISKRVEFCFKIAKSDDVVVSVEDHHRMLSYSNEEDKPFRISEIHRLVNLIGVIQASVLFVAFLLDFNYAKICALIFIVANGLAAGWAYFKTTEISQKVSKLKKGVESYSECIKAISEEEFEDENLIRMKNKLIEDKINMITALKDLEKIINRIELRNNLVSFIVYHIILLGEYRWYAMYTTWKKRYRANLEPWLDIISEFECMVSFATINQTNSKTSIPVISGKNSILRFRELGHPLISEPSRVCNSVDMNNKIFVITGSNMSGKTTFLRTIGVNLVLAYCGSSVCSSEFECSIMDINTSMRVRDDLNEGLSSFYFELKKIKRIIDNGRRDINMIFLIDEIFRGTNSRDRIFGAEKVLRELDLEKVIGGITTHDFELCRSSRSNPRVFNYHFNEYFEEDQMKFDYKIKPGSADTANARFLMKMVGINVEEDSNK